MSGRPHAGFAQDRQDFRAREHVDLGGSSFSNPELISPIVAVSVALVKIFCISRYDGGASSASEVKHRLVQFQVTIVRYSQEISRWFEEDLGSEVVFRFDAGHAHDHSLLPVRFHELS